MLVLIIPIILFLEISVLVLSVELIDKKFIYIDDIFKVAAFNNNTLILLAFIILVLSVVTFVFSELRVLTLSVELTVI